MKTAKNIFGKGNLTNGIRASQTISTEQQAKPAAQLNQETFNKMMAGEPTDPPKDGHDAAVRMNQATAKGLLDGSIKPSQVTEKKAPSQEVSAEHPRSYADMFKELNKGMVETPEQRRNREKKERTDAIVRSVGDGLSALARMYYATKGATTAHNPENDLTATANKRKEYFDQQREKNKAAWLTGYQRALALDEEARKNNMTAAEAFRYHNMLQNIKEKNASQSDRRLDQADERLNQNQQKLDLTKYKYDTEKEYKESMLDIKKLLANGQITRWQAQTAIGELTEKRLAAKGNGTTGKKNTAAGYWNEYYEAMSTLEGKAKIQQIIRQNPSLRKVNQNSVRFIMDRYHGRKTSAKIPSASGSKPSVKNSGNKPTSSKKKSTGVNWK